MKLIELFLKIESWKYKLFMHLFNTHSFQQSPFSIPFNIYLMYTKTYQNHSLLSECTKNENCKKCTRISFMIYIMA